MIQAAATELKMSSSRTMATAQKLYEQGLISYHRTDLPNLSNEAFAQITDYANSNELPVVAEKRVWVTSESAQEAHEAIRPSDIHDTAAGADDDQQRLYRLIWTRALCSQLENARWTVRKAQLKAAEKLDDRKIMFQATGRILTSPGWRQLLNPLIEEANPDEQEQLNNPIPGLQPGELLQSVDGQLLSLSTSPPALYTESSLVKELEKQGIGRPSTFATIISTITKREYVELQKNKFHDTDLGKTVVHCLVGQFSFMEYDFTRRMEALLDAIARSETPLLLVVRGFYARLLKELQGVTIAKAYSWPCPKCGKPLQFFAKGKYGPWWACSGYEDGCKVALPDDDGKPGKRKPLDTEYPCPSCGIGYLRRLVKAKAAGVKGYDFWVCSADNTVCNFKCNSIA
jgi:DNA topoisomerase-1